MPQKTYLKDFYWKDYFYITIGLFLYALGFNGFIIPNNLITGGVTGISRLIEQVTDIPLYYSYLVINCILLAVALKVLGFKFLVKTIYGVLMLTFFLWLTETLFRGGLVEAGGLFAGAIGGMLCGAGIGIVFNAGGTTGGLDTVVAIIKKYKNVSLGRGLMFCDLAIISSSYFISRDYQVVIGSLIVMGISTYTIDMVINGFRQSIQVMVFSKKYAEIADAINSEMHRGCTVLDGTGWYTKEAVKVIVVLTKRSESNDLFRLIKGIDENAFISQSNVRGVYGKGFDHMG